jgi:hypothetical protein
VKQQVAFFAANKICVNQRNPAFIAFPPLLHFGAANRRGRLRILSVDAVVDLN